MTRAAARSVRGEALSAGVITGLGIGAAIRRVSVRTGVTDAEANAALPGDQVIPHPMVEWTRGVTVAATPPNIWPWLVQQGFDRAGWYTPAWVDRITHPLLFGMSGTPASDDRIIPDYQSLEAGDIVADGPDHGAYFHVLQVERNEAIVYYSVRHPWRPNPVDPQDPTSIQRAEHRLRRDGVYLEFTWTFVLSPLDGARTRLLIRTRANFAPRAIRFLVPALGLFDATYGVATMRAIARRAEQTTEHAEHAGLVT